MARTRIVWSKRADEGRAEIRAWIAKNAPRTAAAFEKRLKAEVNRLKRFPFLGGMVEDYDEPSIRQIHVKNVRIVYRVNLPIIEIVIVQRAARLLDPKDFEPG